MYKTIGARPYRTCPREIHLHALSRRCKYAARLRHASSGYRARFGEEDPGMIIDCAYYQDGRRRDDGAASLQEAAAQRGAGGFVWLGLFEPGDDELAEVRDTFGLHELAIEDAQNVHTRPKIETYDQGVSLVILRTAHYDDVAEEVQFGQISVFLSPTFVITVRRGVASELRGARQRLEQRPELLATGTPAALWAILDQVVDGYGPVVSGLEHDIDQIEATVFSGEVASTERIYSLRGEATDFYRAVHPLLAVVNTVRRTSEVPKLKPYLRDVQDHLLLVDEEVVAQRDLLATVLQANIAVLSVEQTKISLRQNFTIEQLTILATVFLPLTFVTGFFGQNFGWLVKNIDGFGAFMIFGIGGLAVPLTLLFLWLRHRSAS
jgi:magnesium transporter